MDLEPASGEGDEALASALRELAATDDSRARPLRAGELVGDRYVVERRIGHGGMGVVYRAIDRDLDRRVALKIAAEVSDLALTRLGREARALAKLSHPNVVVVYEVGRHEDGAFVAMELVDGGTARDWARARRRSEREVLALYGAAGDGLGAAHAAGILHRDFKPDNVLLGRDGRPRVADFGLSIALDDVLRSEHANARAPDDTSELFTASGAIVGTIAYMAPERLEGEPGDARADQFSFCVAVWEALFGRRPFAGTNAGELRAALRAEAPRAEPGSASRAIVDALLRGLRADPSARWSSMASLLHELRRVRRGAPRRWIVAVTAAVATIGLATIARRPTPDPCATLEPRAQRALRPLEGLQTPRGAPRASTGLAAFVASVDDYGEELAAAERAACRATAARAAPLDAADDRRDACLRRAASSLEELVAQTVASPPSVLARANVVLDALPDVARCDDVERGGGEIARPRGADVRARVDAIEAELARREVRFVLERRAGDPRDADALVDRAGATGWAPLVAEATLSRGLELKSIDARASRAALEDAAALGLAASDDVTVAWALVSLADLATDGSDLAGARSFLNVAKGATLRAGDPPAIAWWIASTEARLAELGAHPADARAFYDREVELLRRGRASVFKAPAISMAKAAALFVAEDTDGAQREIERALKSAEEVYGDDQPALVDVLALASTIAVKRGDLALAERHCRRAAAIVERSYGAQSTQLVGQLQSLSAIQERRRDAVGAQATVARALAILDATEVSDQTAGELEHNAAIAALARGDVDEAERRSARAREVLVRLFGESSPRLVDVELVRGAIARAKGDLAGAEQSQRRAVALADGASSGVDVVNPRVELSYTLVRERKGREAVELLRPVLAREASVEPLVAAELHLAFAQALWVASDAPGARREAGLAASAYERLGAGFEEKRDEARAWLRAHGG